MKKAAKMDALAEMAGGKQEIPEHEVKCPNCGHEWVMGEDEYEDDEDSEDEYS